MPTKKTRVNLTLDDDLNALISDISALQGRSKAGIITDMLKEVKPALEDLRASLRHQNALRDSIPRIVRANISDLDLTEAQKADYIAQGDLLDN